MIIEKEYYSDNSRISNSAIGWFIKKGPRYFKDMLDGKEQGLTGKFLERGTMIHMYLLEPEDFWKNYVILDFVAPKYKQQKDAIDDYATACLMEPLEDKDKLKLAAYKSAYNNKYSDEKCIEEMNNLINTYQDYITYLQHNNENKTVISFADLHMLKNIEKNIKEHKKASDLLEDKPSCESHNEFYINWESPKYNLPCKSLIDRCIFDHANKKITLIDLKTTSDVYNFKHSVEEFDYYRQITFYLLAITWYMNDLGIDITDYDCEAYIIAIQTNGNNEVRVFNMLNEQELDDRKQIILDALSELSYHYSTNNWDHTRNYYENDGTEELSA